MPPKKATGASKKAAPTAHSSYRDMIKDAIVNLKERNGSSRQAIKKYVTANNKLNVASQATFDAQFNKAIKAGVEKGEFTQPKGPSGPVKLAKKDTAAKPAAKPAAKATAKSTTKTTAKKPAAKATATKKAAPKKATAAKAGTKKTTTKKTTASKPKAKANTGKARKTSTAAPAVVEQPKVIGKTKSGRVTKTTAPAPSRARAAPKKRTTKK
ncbi:Histone H1 [Penicillium riverlandense]|uniref:Histone H1 n=1 Tax=Penicillium riverlandense TaxID=1903569 RepID=UPI0025491930|nr:Histone H1 [Penicillium riverlandense]KAJ5819768.1 Histone H1 [Penicillium riverlandense]